MSTSKIEIGKQYTKNKNLLINSIKTYLKNYQGIPKKSWHHILLTLVNDMATGVSFFFPLYFVNILNINIAKAGLIISCYGFGKALGGFLGGKLTDKISSNIVILSCLIIQVLIFIAISKVYTLNLLMVLQFILGMSSYAFTTANKVCVLNSIVGHEKVKIKILSTFYAASNLGIGLSAMIVSWLEGYGFNYIFFVSSTILAVSAISFSFQIQKKQTQPRIISSILENNKQESSKLAINHKPLLAWLVLLCLFCIGLIIAQLGSTYPIYLSTTFPTFGVHAVSIAFTINSFLILFFQTPVVNYLCKNNKILMVGLGAFLMAGGMSLLANTSGFLIVIVSMLTYTIGEMIFFSMAQFVVYQHSSDTNKGQSLGLFQTTLAMSFIIGPTLGGYIYHHFGGQVLWYCSGLVGLFWLLISMYFKKYDIIEQN